MSRRRKHTHASHSDAEKAREAGAEASGDAGESSSPDNSQTLDFDGQPIENDILETPPETTSEPGCAAEIGDDQENLSDCPADECEGCSDEACQPAASDADPVVSVPPFAPAEASTCTPHYTADLTTSQLRAAAAKAIRKHGLAPNLLEAVELAETLDASQVRLIVSRSLDPEISQLLRRMFGRE